MMYNIFHYDFIPSTSLAVSIPGEHDCKEKRKVLTSYWRLVNELVLAAVVFSPIPTASLASWLGTCLGVSIWRES
jgi:hypothetical protein